MLLAKAAQALLAQCMGCCQACLLFGMHAAERIYILLF
jgi:hypothetical protein